MKEVFLEKISVTGPGLPDWETTREILTGARPYNINSTTELESSLLTKRNKRRTTDHMKVAIKTAGDILQQTDINKDDMELVCSTSEGDMYIACDICNALALEDKNVSPAQFQNVILGAAAGHLGIYIKNNSGATTVTGGVYSFSVGLLQAYSSLISGSNPTLFVSYDAPGPEQFGKAEADKNLCAIGLLMTKEKTANSIASLTPSLIESTKIDLIEDDDDLEALRSTTPAAAGLSLIKSIATRSESPVAMAYSKDMALQVKIKNCA